MTSTIKVNNIQNQCGANIINENSNTITIGASGDTIALASGASQSGFGRTGTVDWQTSIKTAASFSAVNGEGYFVDTSSNAVTANLPAGSVGAIVAFKDYAQNFDTNALTIAANGSEKIENLTSDLVLNTEGVAVTLVYGDATRGWQAVYSNEITNSQKFVTATGGTETTVCTNFKVHTFTGPGTFQVTCAGNPLGSTSVDYLVVAGGASGGGGSGAGGGGAGGYRESPGAASGCYSVSPLGTSPAAALPVSVQDYTIVVGAGGAALTPSCKGNSGSVSTFSSITSAGGGGGGGENAPAKPGVSGGSGGGGQGNPSNISGGTGNTPPTNPSQGNNGGNGVTNYAGGGGGGAGGVGGTGPNPAGAGGAGATSSINGTPTARAGGGGGGNQPPAGNGPGPATAGGGDGGVYAVQVGQDATANTGGGGGGNAFVPSGPSNTSGAGGSGIVIIRYKFQ